MVEQYVQPTGEFMTPVGMNEVGQDPAPQQDLGWLFTKEVSGVTELFYEDDLGIVTQLTGGGSLVHSLDQAYDDGRIITVDAGAVELNVSSGQSRGIVENIIASGTQVMGIEQVWTGNNTSGAHDRGIYINLNGFTNNGASPFTAERIQMDTGSYSGSMYGRYLSYRSVNRIGNGGLFVDYLDIQANSPTYYDVIRPYVVSITHSGTGSSSSVVFADYSLNLTGPVTLNGVNVNLSGSGTAEAKSGVSTYSAVFQGIKTPNLFDWPAQNLRANQYVGYATLTANNRIWATYQSKISGTQPSDGEWFGYLNEHKDVTVLNNYYGFRTLMPQTITSGNLYGFHMQHYSATVLPTGASERYIYLNADNLTVNAGATFYGIDLDMNGMTDTGTVNAIRMTLPDLGTALYIDQATVDAGAKNLIYADIDVGAIPAGQYFRGSYLDIDETVVGNDGSFIVGQEIDTTGVSTGRADLIGIKMLIDGTKDGGDNTYGILIDVDVTLNNGSETIYGISVDMSGLIATNSNDIYGHYVYGPALERSYGMYFKAIRTTATNDYSRGYYSDITYTGTTQANGGGYTSSHTVSAGAVVNNILGYYSFFNASAGSSIGGGPNKSFWHMMGFSMNSADLTGVNDLGGVYIWDTLGSGYVRRYYGLRVSTSSFKVGAGDLTYGAYVNMFGTIEAGGQHCGAYIQTANFSYSGGDLYDVYISTHHRATAIYIDSTLNPAVDKNIIHELVNCGAITGGSAVRGSHFDINETVIGNDGSAIVAHSVQLTGFATGRADLTAYHSYFDGTKSGGDITRGLFVESVLTLNNAGEQFYGIDIDMASMTVTSGVARGIRVQVPAGQMAGEFNGNVEVNGAGNWLAPPRMTTTQRNTMIIGWGAPEAGRSWFNTTTSQFEGWNGTTVAILG